MIGPLSPIHFTGARRSRGQPATTIDDNAPSRFQDQRTDEGYCQPSRAYQSGKRREPRLRMSVPRRTRPQHFMGDTTIVARPPEGVARGNQLGFRTSETL